MTDEMGALMQLGEVQVWGPRGERYRLSGMDLVQGEVHLTVVPTSPPIWTVVVVNGNDRDTYGALTLDEALALARPDRGAMIVVWEVAAPDVGAAQCVYRKGKRVSQFAWLGY